MIWYIVHMARRRGVALMMIMLLMVVLVAMLKAVTQLAHTDSFQARGHYERTLATYAAEAAAQDALEQLANDSSWTAGFHQKQLSDVRAHYTIRFADSGGESVNNIGEAVPADGPRGPGTVPPFTADLVITVQAGSLTKKFEVLAAADGVREEVLVAHSLAASGRLRMRGNVQVDGIRTLSSDATSSAGIHSNYSGTEAAISWEPIDPADEAVIEGQVSTTGAAIDFAPNHTVGSFVTDAPTLDPPPIDIPGEIAAASGAPAPPIVSFGTTTLAGQNYYQGGDLTINGDLELDDGGLYVSGNLTVNGSISGKGAIYVAGQTAFQGDSELLTNNDAGVAVYSRGNIQLTGFRGSEYLDALAASDPVIDNHWSQAKATFNDMQSMMQSESPMDLLDDWRTLQEMSRSLADPDGPTHAGRENDSVGQLLNHVRAQPAGSTRDFLITKLETVREIYGEPNRNPRYIVRDWERGNTSDMQGLFRAILSEANGGGWGWGCPICNPDQPGNTGLMEQMINLTNQISYDRIGSAYFQGLLYTNGSIYAAHEVNIVGSARAHSDGSQVNATVGGVDLAPGDIFLDSGISMTFNEQYQQLQDVALNGPGSGSATIRAWLEP